MGDFERPFCYSPIPLILPPSVNCDADLHGRGDHPGNDRYKRVWVYHREMEK
jgi:hypothetical protein